MAYQKIKLRDLSKSVGTLEGLRITRPQRGWLRVVREALGMSLDQVAKNAAVPRQHISRYEQFEASEKITLASLRKIAVAMGCELVYAIVPKSGTFAELAEQVARQKSVRAVEKARQQAERLVRAVDHTMALEGQGTGRVNERIQEETQRILKRRKR